MYVLRYACKHVCVGLFVCWCVCYVWLLGLSGVKQCRHVRMHEPRGDRWHILLFVCVLLVVLVLLLLVS